MYNIHSPTLTCHIKHQKRAERPNINQRGSLRRSNNNRISSRIEPKSINTHRRRTLNKFNLHRYRHRSQRHNGKRPRQTEMNNRGLSLINVNDRFSTSTLLPAWLTPVKGVLMLIVFVVVNSTITEPVPHRLLYVMQEPEPPQTFYCTMPVGTSDSSSIYGAKYLVVCSWA